MVHLLVVTHQFDLFLQRSPRHGGEVVSFYMLYPLLQALAHKGVTWKVVAGPARTAADAAILHVDSTFVDAEYLTLDGLVPCPINFGATDISKRNVSGALLGRNTHWNGPVVVKTNRNVMGKLEAVHNRRAHAHGYPIPHPDLAHPQSYRLFENIYQVAEEIWDDPDLVVERFVPERDPLGFAVRNWSFAGEREICTRNVARGWIVKGVSEHVDSRPVPVPDEMRAERTRLGFDYGNFDFVVHDGEPILLDASRTPGAPAELWEWTANIAADFADGLLAMIRTC